MRSIGSRLVGLCEHYHFSKSTMAARHAPRPGFLLSCAFRSRPPHARIPIQCRSLNNTTPSIEADSLPPDPPSQMPQTLNHDGQRADVERHLRSTRQQADALQHASGQKRPNHPEHYIPPHDLGRGHTPRYDLSRAPQKPKYMKDFKPRPTTTSSEVPTQTESTTPKGALQNLDPILRAQIAHLATQTPHYIIIHIHGKPYLVTAGDTIRLPFLMHGVMPGDVLRLDRASQIGSREWTLRAGAVGRPSSSTKAQPPAHTSRSPQGTAEGQSEHPIIGKTEDLHLSITQGVPFPNLSTQLKHSRPKVENRLGYLDPSLFFCRATVLGTESEPLRIKEKTKRRQRRVKRVFSKHRYTVLRINQVEVRGFEEE